MNPLMLAVCLTAAIADDEVVSFERHVRPILRAYCFNCHGEGASLKGGLDLRLRRFIVRGGKQGPAIVDSDPATSKLYLRIAAGEMPPNEVKVPERERQIIRRWIEQGALTDHPEPESVPTGFYISEADKSFWAFQPIVRPAVPEVAAAVSNTTALDRFILEALEQKGLGFAPAANRRTLIRRVYLDLLGILPEPDAVDRFVADRSPDGYERLVDRLLASPLYGENWARGWLDVAGYADSEGYSDTDLERKYAYKFRDYVISALNGDKPWDQFITEQLAGDELSSRLGVNDPLRVEQLAATGFLRMAPDGTDSQSNAESRNQVLAETVKVVTSSLMAITVGCAQCHNHRYDPIPQTDYYRLRAIFEPALNPASWKTPRQRLLSLYTDQDRRLAAEIEKQAKRVDAERTAKQQGHIERVFQQQLAKLDESLHEPIKAARSTPANKRTAAENDLLKEHPSVNVTAGSLYLYDRKAADELKGIAARATEIRNRKPIEDFVRPLIEPSGPVPVTYRMERGDVSQPKEAVPAGGLAIFEDLFEPIPQDDPKLASSGRRLAFARRLVGGNHPLVARVLVNRVWLHHFGRGLVATPGDFGALGERPSHPALLDWLAAEFTAGGWELKKLQRLIVLSTVYRQSSSPAGAGRRVDPENRLYWRAPVRRLTAEVLRDCMIQVAGKLNHQAYGVPVPVARDLVGQVVVGVDTTDGAGRPTGKVVDLKGQQYRRSVYVQVRRSLPLTIFQTFDFPELAPNCLQRSFSTVPTQALLMMNSDLAVDLSAVFARRVLDQAGSDVAAQISLCWRIAYGRRPRGEEISAARQFLDAQNRLLKSSQSSHPRPGPGALSILCQALISSNEFMYVD